MPIRPSRRNRMVALVIVAAGLAAGVALLLVHVTGGGGKAAAAAPEAKLQRNLDALVAAGAPGAVVLVRDGKRVSRLTSGYGDLKVKTPIRIDDRFRVGSVTKTFVATVVVQLVEQGKLSFNDTVEHWLPGLVPNGKAITVHELLNHTAGLFDYLNDGDNRVFAPYVQGKFAYRWKPRDLVRVATSHPPHFAPGKGWHYCNTCYVLLGLIIEKATGHPLGTELRQRIFEPLGLRDTTFDTEPRIAGRFAHGYELLGKPPLLDASAVSPSWGWAAGAIVSTVDDIARFYRALLEGKPLGERLVRSMKTTVAMGTHEPSRYGLGLVSALLACGTVWGHDGGTIGYRTWALSSEDGRRQVVVFANLSEDSLSKSAVRALNQVLMIGYCG